MDCGLAKSKADLLDGSLGKILPQRQNLPHLAGVGKFPGLASKVRVEIVQRFQVEEGSHVVESAELMPDGRVRQT